MPSEATGKNHLIMAASQSLAALYVSTQGPRRAGRGAGPCGQNFTPAIFSTSSYPS